MVVNSLSYTSIEIAKDNIAYMEEVNAELGAYKK